MDRFFGYGSLVNRATHDYPDAMPATLGGWRRIWCRTQFRDTAYLSVAHDASCEIDGLVAGVPGGDWAALNAREAAYDKQMVETTAGSAQVYAVPARNQAQSGEISILLSYLDVVVQGFLKEFGEAGVARFFETTGNWGNIHDDRAAPIYVRAQVLSAEETALVNEWVARVGFPLDAA